MIFSRFFMSVFCTNRVSDELTKFIKNKKNHRCYFDPTLSIYKISHQWRCDTCPLHRHTRGKDLWTAHGPEHGPL
jgi:hypothetical protein